MFAVFFVILAVDSHVVSVNKYKKKQKHVHVLFSSMYRQGGAFQARAQYALRGVADHHGSDAGSGHWTARIRTDASETWLKFDDWRCPMPVEWVCLHTLFDIDAMRVSNILIFKCDGHRTQQVLLWRLVYMNCNRMLWHTVEYEEMQQSFVCSAKQLIFFKK